MGRRRFFFGGLRWWVERAAVSLPHVSVGGERWGDSPIREKELLQHFFRYPLAPKWSNAGKSFCPK